jgi:hypothetical protein
MKTAIVYCYWQSENRDAFRDMRNPIVPAIATVRASCDLPIYVIDLSDGETNWAEFPQILNFTVVKSFPCFAKFGIKNKMCSRVSNIREFALSLDVECVSFLDSDVFWRRDFLPLSVDPSNRFCCHEYNTGVFYYDVKSEAVDNFLQLWSSFILCASMDDSLASIVLQSYPFKSGVQDEAVYNFLREKHLGDLPISFLPTTDNYTGCSLKVEPDITNYNEVLPYHEEARNYHCFKRRFGPNRGLFPLIVDEFYERMKSVLSDRELSLIYQDKLNLKSRIVLSVTENVMYEFNSVLAKPDWSRLIL